MSLRIRFAVSFCAGATALASADVVTDWNAIALQAIRNEATAPPKAARSLAMMHAAVYDAVNSIARTHTPYLVDHIADPGCSREAAAAQAARDVMVSVFPAQAATFNAALSTQLGGIPNGPAKTDGIAVGSQMATAMIASRAADGSTFNPPYTPGTNPGDWRPTPPGFQPPALPGWGSVTPFGIPSGAAYRAPAPPALTSAEYTAAWNEVKELGSATSATRTADQTEIAVFWRAGGGTNTPPGMWNKIAEVVGTAQGNSLEDNARMFALLNLGTADAAIAAWDTKYTYNHWRPIAGIREADTDGNADTTADPAWTPLFPTPNHPSYVSGHSTFSATGAAILADFFGSDTIPFSFSGDDLPGVFRNFDGFSDAAAEAGMSRIYGGIHWQYDNIWGQNIGNSVGSYIFDHYMQPIPEPASVAMVMLAGVFIRRRR